MRSNHAKQRLAAGEASIGTWTAIQLVTIAVGAYRMLRERRRTQSG